MSHSIIKFLFILFGAMIVMRSGLGGVTLLAQASFPPEVINYADKILYNGKILTADDKFTIAEAVAIRDGKILAVGASDRIQKMAGPKTERVDLRGKTVTPGFVEVHSRGNFEGGHGGTALSYKSNGIQFPTLDEGIRRMREVVLQKGKPGEILFFTTGNEKPVLGLNRKLLDGIAPDVPIVMIYMTHGVINSQTLKLIPPELPGVEKDAQGEATGHVYMPIVGYLTYDLLPWPDPQEMEQLVQNQRQILEHVPRLGITSIGGRAHGLAVTILHDLWQRGLQNDPSHPLPVRVRFSSEIVRMNPYAEGVLKRMGNISGIGDEWFKLYGANLYAVEFVGEDMLTLKPKRIEAGNRGPYGADTWGLGLGDNWKEVNGTDFKSLLLANRYGWPVMDFHNNGDGSTELVLDAFEKANRERPIAGRRFGFVHGLMRTPDQLQRLAKYDTILSITPSYLFYQPKTVERLKTLYGADALHGYSPVKSIIRAGMKPILESNYEFRPSNLLMEGEFQVPAAENQTHLWLIEKLITRKQENAGVIWGADERVSRQEALWMATNWAARFYQDERLMGTVEPGKLADLVILGQDYMTVPEDQIAKIPILQTIVGGKVVYQNPAN